MSNLRPFTIDSAFPRSIVFKTPFRDDVARIHFREDNRIVLQHGGTSIPYNIEPRAKVHDVLTFASDVLDNWVTQCN